VDNRSEGRDFLASRRARITPEKAGLPTYGDKRRVSGQKLDRIRLFCIAFRGGAREEANPHYRDLREFATVTALFGLWSG